MDGSPLAGARGTRVSFHGPLIRALVERIPDDATVAAAIGPDEYLYPLYDGRLRREVVYVPNGGSASARASLLVVGPGGHARVCEADWETTATPAVGWRILRRVGAGGCGVRGPA